MSSRIVVLAGGWSVFKLSSTDRRWIFGRCCSIGVNDSALKQQCDYALSMDRIWLEARLPLLRRMYEPAWIYVRKGVVKEHGLVPAGVIEFDCDPNEHKMSLMKDRLNGTNSGTCAVNLALKLAIQRKAKDVYLLGFDMRQGPGGQKHWYPSDPLPTTDGGERPHGTTKPSKFRAWANEFEAIRGAFLKQGKNLINVIDPNHPSAILDLPTMTQAEFIRHLGEQP